MFAEYKAVISIEESFESTSNGIVGSVITDVKVFPIEGC